MKRYFGKWIWNKYLKWKLVKKQIVWSESRRTYQPIYLIKEWEWSIETKVVLDKLTYTLQMSGFILYFFIY